MQLNENFFLSVSISGNSSIVELSVDSTRYGIGRFIYILGCIELYGALISVVENQVCMSNMIKDFALIFVRVL